MPLSASRSPTYHSSSAERGESNHQDLIHKPVSPWINPGRPTSAATKIKYFIFTKHFRYIKHFQSMPTVAVSHRKNGSYIPWLSSYQPSFVYAGTTFLVPIENRGSCVELKYLQLGRKVALLVCNMISIINLETRGCKLDVHCSQPLSRWSQST